MSDLSLNHDTTTILEYVLGLTLSVGSLVVGAILLVREWTTW